MCDPVSAAIALTIATTAVQAVGQIQQGKAQRAATEYNAQVSEQNAKVAEQYAQQERARGATEASIKRSETRRLIAKQQANMAAGGIDISSGNPLDILSDTAFYGELDAQTLVFNSELKARSRENEGVNLRNQAELQRMEGRNALRSSRTAAVGTVLGGASKAFSLGASSPSGGYYDPKVGSQGASSSTFRSGKTIYWDN